MNFFTRKVSARIPGRVACFVLLLLLTIALPSCKKEYFAFDRVKDGTWNPELAVPLIKSTVTVPEILGRFDDQDIITIDPATGLLALRYFSTVFSIQAEKWFEVPRLQVAPPVPLTAQDIVDVTVNGSKTVTGSVVLPFAGNNGESLDEISFKNGNLSIQVSSTVGYNSTVSLTFPGLLLGSTPYTTGPMAVPAGGTGPLISSSMINRIWDLTLTGNPSAFEVLYSITYNGPGAGAIGQALTIDMDMSGNNSFGGPEYSEIKGDFGQQAIDVPMDSVRLRIFDNDAGGIILWDSAIARGTFFNTFGLAVTADLPVFTVKNVETATTLPVIFPNGMLPFTIPAASASYVPGTSSFDLNINNSNINAALNINPNRLIYDGDITANPGSGPYNNFMRDTSALRLDIDVILPLDGRAIDFTRRDTADVAIFPLDGDVEEIVSVTIRLTLDNGFPADAFAQVYLMDTTGTVLIDSLFPEARKQIFASPTPNQFGQVDQTQKVRTVTDIVMDRTKLQKLEDAGFGKVILYGWIDSFAGGSQRIKIFENYTMDMWLGMMVEAKVKIDF